MASGSTSGQTEGTEELEGINILITGGNGPIGQAIIDLGFQAGASKFFCDSGEEISWQFTQIEYVPLTLDAKEWLPLHTRAPSLNQKNGNTT